MKRILVLFLLAVVNIAMAQLGNCKNESNVGTLKACSVYVNKKVTTDTLSANKIIGTLIGNGLPTAGSTNQVLYKQSGTDYNVSWRYVVTNVSSTGTQGVTTSVTNSGTTPNVLIGLGAITPTSVNTGTVTSTFGSFTNLSATNPIAGTTTGNAYKLIATSVKTSNYTAAVSDYVPCNTTSSGFTVTLPTPTISESRIGIKHVIQGGTNVVTVVTSGSDVFNKAGGGTSVTLPLLNQAYIFQYDLATAIWYVQTADFTLSSLDSRYAPITSGTSILKGNGSGGTTAATAGTDYCPPTSTSSILKGNGSGGTTAATSGTDYCPATSTNLLLKGNGSGGTASATGSSDIASSLTDETGSGSVVFNNAPSLSSAAFSGTNSSIGKFNFTPPFAGNIEGDSGNSTPRITLSTYQQSNKSGGCYGDLVRFISEHGSAKGGLKWYGRGASAQVITTNSEPFAVTTGMTLTLKINGSAVRTVTFNTSLSGTSFTSGAATADQISDIICKSINFTSYPSGQVNGAYYGQASPYLTQTGTTVNQDALKVVINSCSYGVLSSVEITGGTALSALGLSVGTSYGSAGTITFDDGTTASPRAWIVAHDYPNNPASNNPHKHVSFEVPDSSGEMQTRLGITYGKNVSEITVSSSIFIVNGYPITISNSANSFKDLDFSRDNTGRQISRVATIRTDSDANGGNVLHKVYDNAGTPTTLLTLNRLSKYVAAGGAIQQKIRTSANTSQSVMTLSPQNGNAFVLSGTSTVNYIANTDWQAGSEITIILQGAATLTNNAGSPTSTNRPLLLTGSTNYTAPANGSSHRFVYDGSGYTNKWIEVSRIAY